MLLWSVITVLKAVTAKCAAAFFSVSNNLSEQERKNNEEYSV